MASKGRRTSKSPTTSRKTARKRAPDRGRGTGGGGRGSSKTNQSGAVDKTPATPSAMGDELLNMDQAIAVLKTSRPTFYRWLRSGKLKGTKVGRQWRFYRKDIEHFLRGEGPRIDLAADIDPLIERLTERLEAAGVDAVPSAELSEAASAAHLMIQLGSAMRASDLHLSPNVDEHGQASHAILRYRVDGVLHLVAEIDLRLLPALVDQFKVMSACDLNERSRPQDGRIIFEPDGSEEPIDLRVCFLPVMHGESLTARLLSRVGVLLDLDRIDYAPHDKQRLARWVDAPWGLIVVAGPTGCGKTTTLYACVNQVAKPELKVMTVEDPVEYMFPWMVQVQINERAGLTFPVATRSVLRSDPDVILIGELREPETLFTAQAAALTGHLVMTTLHADEAARALVRMVDMGSEPFVVTNATKLVVAQRLIRKLCPHCAVDDTPSDDLLHQAKSLARTGGVDWDTLRKGFRRPVGCTECRQLGFLGRNVIAETLEVTSEIAAALGRGASVEEIRAIAVGQGMTTMAADGVRKAAEGITTLDETIRVVGLR